jgi:hypothetical protein
VQGHAEAAVSSTARRTRPKKSHGKSWENVAVACAADPI